MTRGVQTGLAIVVVIFGLGLIGCADDLYGECQLPETEDGDSLEACEREDESRAVSCVVEQQTECDTGACGQYQDSAPFCTMRCESDEDCGAGECLEFVFQSEYRYCVQYENL